LGKRREKERISSNIVRLINARYMLHRIHFIILLLILSPLFTHPGNEPEEKGKTIRPADPVPSNKPNPSIFIMDKGEKPVPRMIHFMLQFNQSLDTAYLSKLLRTYISECKMEGVNHDIAVCQMCLETGFLRFNGSVSKFQNNFCGLGATDAYSAGDWFGSMEEGVRAHIQHLKAYASTDPLQTEPVDKRFRHVHRGTVFTLYDLTGRWATDPKYGEKLELLLRKLYEK